MSLEFFLFVEKFTLKLTLTDPNPSQICDIQQKSSDDDC